MSIDTLSYLAMERCRSSREAVELMGSFATRYGFYGPPDSFEGSGESLIVGDPDEAWAFQILSDPTGTSAIWAARRLPDTDMTVVANMFTIRVVDGSDSADVNSLHVSADGSFFASGGADKKVNVWNYDEGSCYYVGEGHSGAVQKVRISPDESRIISVGTEGGIFIWKVPDPASFCQ